MPVILDRLPLPNITWYTGISVLCLLCSVYYAGVQVKLHPDWKEQLLQRRSASVESSRGDKYSYPYDRDLPIFWGVFNANDQDEEGFCFPEDEPDGINDLEDVSLTLLEDIQEVCSKETFEDILRSVFYEEMCYIRYNSDDVAFHNYIKINAAQVVQGKKTYSPAEYSRRCQQAARKLAVKYRTSNAAKTINVKMTLNGFSDVQDKTIKRSLKHTKTPSKSSVLYNDDHKSHRNAQAKLPLNQCTTDTFYDSYERDINSEVSLYHIPLPHRGCDDMERELSPYLIPEIVSFMFHEPLCIWTLINMAYCVLILLGTTIQHMVFGELRVSEQQHIKDKFWNFVFYKFIFVFGVMNVKHMDEAVLWCSWFSVLGFLHLLAQLCKDRFEFLSFSGHTGRRTHIRLLCLLGIILLVASGCLVISVLVGCHAGINTFAFMAAECVLLIVRTLYVITRYSLYLWDVSHQGLWEKRGGYVYVTELVFELSELTIDMVHHIHMLVWGNIMLTMASLVICMQLRLLFYQLQHRVKTHRNYLRVRKLLARYPEVCHPPEDHHQQQKGVKEAVTCVICWECVCRGRRLPCQHVFHTDCLLAWLPQHLSCPTCRHKLRPTSSQRQTEGGLLAWLFSRRSSDPLDARTGGDNSGGSSNTSSRSPSRTNSSHNSPHHATRVAADPSVAGDGAGISASGAGTEGSVMLVLTGAGDAADGFADTIAADNDLHSFANHGTNNSDTASGSTRHRLLYKKSSDNSGHSDHGDDSDSDSEFWDDEGVGDPDHHRNHRRRHHGTTGGDGGGGAANDGWRYVSWLSSFSVEQRHTQFPPVHQHGVSPVPECSVHSMASQVQQLFPHVPYSVIVADLCRTRSIAVTVDNILEDSLPGHVPHSPRQVTNTSPVVDRPMTAEDAASSTTSSSSAISSSSSSGSSSSSSASSIPPVATSTCSVTSLSSQCVAVKVAATENSASRDELNTPSATATQLPSVTSINQGVQPSTEHYVKQSTEHHVQPITEHHVQPITELHVQPITEHHVQPITEHHVQQSAEPHVQSCKELHVQPRTWSAEHMEASAAAVVSDTEPSSSFPRSGLETAVERQDKTSCGTGSHRLLSVAKFADSAHAKYCQINQLPTRVASDVTQRHEAVVPASSSAASTHTPPEFNIKTTVLRRRCNRVMRSVVEPRNNCAGDCDG